MKILNKIFTFILISLLVITIANAFVTPDYFKPGVSGTTYVDGIETNVVSPGRNITFNGNAVDEMHSSDSGVNYLRLIDDSNVELARTNCNGAGSCNLRQNISFSTIGTYIFTFEAKDMAGNKAEYEVIVYVVNTLCEVEIIAPLDGDWSWLNFPVFFNSTVWDQEDGTNLSISWMSNHTGIFGF